ncbi:hypothetical protein H6F95_28690 [Cyanobacteria bacterium FACHB-471]|nr:hypothetical protein [Cyanobacteria bacterium FACHB-471]
MPSWSEQELFEHMKQEPWFTPGAIAISREIMDWAGKRQQTSTYWTGDKFPIFNASADSKRFISIMAKKGWDIEIPFYYKPQGYLLERAKNQQAIARLQRMGVKTVNPAPLSPDHRRAIKLDSVNPCLEEFLALLDWIVDEIYEESKLI